MPYKKKKKFITKENSVTFKLEDRSQCDPLILDENASKHVLVPTGRNVEYSDLSSENTVSRRKRLMVQKECGIGYEDDYDYLQHLKPMDDKGTPFADFVPESPNIKSTEGFPTLLDTIEEEQENETVDILRNGKKVLSLPSEFFSSGNQEEESLLLGGYDTKGPKPDWDCDIVETLDDAYTEHFDPAQKKEDLENPEDFMEEDFFAKLVGNDDEEGDENGYNSDQQLSFDGDDCNYGVSDDEFDYDYEDGDAGEGNEKFFYLRDRSDIMSQYTGRSMSSAIMRKTEGHQTIDAKFELILKDYERGNALGDDDFTEEVYGEDRENGLTEEQMLQLIDIKKTKVPMTMENLPMKKEVIEKFSYERNYDEDFVPMYKKVPAIKFDCQSILSLSSNIYNHPKEIQPKVEAVPKAAVKALKKPKVSLKEHFKECDCKACHKQSIAAVSNVRPKGETAEEKAARKKAFKEARKNRRVEKKATKLAFKEDGKAVKKQQMDIARNMSGMKI